MNELDRRYLDIARECSLSYWNALLTANTILIGVFSILGFTDPSSRWFVAGIIMLSFISCALLISNFNDLLKSYRFLSEPISVKEYDAMTDEQKIKINQEGRITYEHLTIRESYVFRLLFIQAFLIAILFLKKLC
jgi:hypothetical protein